MLLLLLLPNVTSSMAILSPPPSPHKAPRVPIIPIEATRRRRRSNNGIPSFDSTKEPTSPKVSCLGQVKKKKPNNSGKPKPKPKPKSICCAVAVEEVVKPPRVKGQKKVDFKFKFEEDKNKVNDVFENVEIKIPSLDQMRRFECGRRGVLSDFDRTTTDHYSATMMSQHHSLPKIKIKV